jgi:hypothetical protein
MVETRDNSQKTYAAGFYALVKQWDKCINVGGGYVEKKMFLQFRISHVLRFISVYDLFTDSASYIYRESSYPCVPFSVLP